MYGMYVYVWYLRSGYYPDTDTAAAVVSLDQKKAFDRVDRNYLSRVLSAFGFFAGG